MGDINQEGRGHTLEMMNPRRETTGSPGPRGSENPTPTPAHYMPLGCVMNHRSRTSLSKSHTRLLEVILGKTLWKARTSNHVHSHSLAICFLPLALLHWPQGWDWG